MNKRTGKFESLRLIENLVIIRVARPGGNFLTTWKSLQERKEQALEVLNSLQEGKIE